MDGSDLCTGLKILLDNAEYPIHSLHEKSKTAQTAVLLINKVGARGIEPRTSCTPCKRASRTALDHLQSSFYDVMYQRSGLKPADVSVSRFAERGQV